MQLAGCHISKSSYSKIEIGFCNVRVSELKAMKNIFHAEWEDFFQGI